MREGSEETDGRGGMEEGRIQRFVFFFCFFKCMEKKSSFRQSYAYFGRDISINDKRTFSEKQYT